MLTNHKEVRAMANSKFREAFETVFDENGNVKLCGREACRRLIKSAMELNPKINFGNPVTGQINLESYPLLKKLYDKEK